MGLFGKRKPDARSSERAAAMASWAASKGWQYVDEFQPTRSVLLARGERNRIYDLITGLLVPGLDCQLFSFVWITSYVDNAGVREYKEHPCIALRVLMPGQLALRYLSVEPAHAGVLGELRDKAFGPRHHNAKQIEVPGLEDGWHVWVLEEDDPALAQQLLSPAVVSTIVGDDRRPLSFQASGSEAMVSAADVTLHPDTTADAEWLVQRAAPFLSEVARIASASPGPSTPFVGPEVVPERPGTPAPQPSFREAMLGRPKVKMGVSASGGGSGSGVSVTKRMTKNLNINVPAAFADKAKAGLEAWLASKGFHAEFAAEPQGDKVKLSFSSDDPSLPDLTDPAVAAELQKVLQDALAS